MVESPQQADIEASGSSAERRLKLAALVTILLLSLTGLLLAFHTWKPIWRAYRAATEWRHLQLDNEEGALLYQAVQFAHGAAVYRPLTDYPYVAGTYPPVYMALTSHFLGTTPTFAAGRIVSLISVIAICTCAAALIYLRRRSVLAALLAPLLFLANFEVYNWIAYYRVDLLAIALSFSGLCCFALARGRPRLYRCSIIFFAFAFFTKQTEVVAPLAAITSLALIDRRAALRYTALLAAAILIPFVIATLLTRGQFAVHTIWYNMNTYHVNDLLIWLRHLARFYGWLLLAALVASVAFIWPRVCRERACPHAQSVSSSVKDLIHQPPVLLLFAVFSTFHVISIGKAGTAENYLLEPLLAIALLVSDGIGELLRQRRIIALPIAALLLLHAVRIHSVAPWIFSEAKNPSAQDMRGASEAISLMRREKNPAWAELGMLSLQSGHDLAFQPFIMAELARQGKWNPQPFHDDLARGRFQLIIANHDFSSSDYTPVYTTQTIAIVRDSFTEKTRLPGRLWPYFIYRFEPPD